MENWQLIVEILTAVGTMAAAGFAGWAAYTSRNAAKASAEMVALERDRDVSNREEERLHQARLVTVDCGTAPVADAAGYPIGVDLMLRVTNAGREPIHKVRLKATAGTATWGPQIVGNLSPGATNTLTARVYVTGDLSNTDGSVRFVDVKQRAWIRTARGTLVEDDEVGLARWIDDGRDAAARIGQLSPAEQGWIPEQPLIPVINSFREAFDLDQENAEN